MRHLVVTVALVPVLAVASGPQVESRSLVELDAAVRRLEKQATEVSQGTWVLWESRRVVRAVPGYSPAPDRPVGAFLTKLECTHEATNHVEAVAGVASSESLSYRVTDGQFAELELVFTCLPERIDPRRPR